MKLCRCILCRCNCTVAVLGDTLGLLCEMGTVSTPLFEYSNQTSLTAAAAEVS